MEEENFSLPVVDERIGDVVAQVQTQDAEIAALVASPKRQLAFRTLAYLRVGLVLGELLVERDVDPERAGAWVEELLVDGRTYERVVGEIRSAAREVAADPRLGGDETGPDPEARRRFRRFARRALEG